MPFKSNLIGKKFGRLFVESKAPSKYKTSYWNCRCDCGVTKTVQSSALIQGATKSCGCLQREMVTARKFKHGHNTRANGALSSRTYQSWLSMIQRCTNQNLKCYKYYGGRGITVCERWRQSFENFIEDMGERPPGLSLERINNDGHYEPSNCKWATRAEQHRNQRHGNRYTVKHHNS